MFCLGKAKIDYKNADFLQRFLSERGKIVPRRVTGTCAKHQRKVARAIKSERACSFALCSRLGLMRQARSTVEGAFLAALTVIFYLSSIYIPVLGFY